MTSTNDGKDVKSNKIREPKGKHYYIELYKSLDAQLNSESSGEERTRQLGEAWRAVHELCVHSNNDTQSHLLSWIQRHTEHAILQTEWKLPKKKLEAAINDFIETCKDACSKRNGTYLFWESQLLKRAECFKSILPNPWGHPVLGALLNPKGEQPTDEEVCAWLRVERGVLVVARLRQLVLAGDCADMALALAAAITSRSRLADPADHLDHHDHTPDQSSEPPSKEVIFTEILKKDAGFTMDVWQFLTDIEFVLLHKTDRQACIQLAKKLPLLNGYQTVERLQLRLEKSPRDKKLWKNAKDVAILIAEVVIARVMVVGVVTRRARAVLHRCVKALVALLPPARLPPAAAALAAPAATAAHLYELAAAVRAQCKEERKSFVCELYVRAITAGMNELERLKLKPEKEAEARLMEETLAKWFSHLGIILSGSARLQCECILTAFSVHPSPKMYEQVNAAQKLVPEQPQQELPETKSEINSEFGSWATDSRTQTNFVKTSETLNIKQTQKQANVLSTAIFTEGEALGLEAELCQDLAVLLSGPRLKTLYWDLDRKQLLENCQTHMERTHCGTRALTTELKYLNLDPKSFLHLPEEVDDETDIYYGIEKGYEQEVEFEEEPVETAWPDPHLYTDEGERTDSACSFSDEIEKPQIRITTKRKKKKTKYPETDPLSLDPICDTNEKSVKKKSKDSSKNINTEEKDTSKSIKTESVKDSASVNKNVDKEQRKKERRKERRERKKKEKLDKQQKDKAELDAASGGALSRLIGLKVAQVPDIKQMVERNKHEKQLKTNITACTTDSDYDSQGKSSLNSEGNDPNVVFDGLFSIDDLELKSPEKYMSDTTINTNVEHKSNLNVQERDIGHTTYIASILRNTPTTKKNENYLIENTKLSSREISQRVSQTLKPSAKESAKGRLKKLLEYRRQKHIPQSQPKLKSSNIQINSNIQKRAEDVFTDNQPNMKRVTVPHNVSNQSKHTTQKELNIFPSKTPYASIEQKVGPLTSEGYKLNQRLINNKIITYSDTNIKSSAKVNISSPIATDKKASDQKLYKSNDFTTSQNSIIRRNKTNTVSTSEPKQIYKTPNQKQFEEFIRQSNLSVKDNSQSSRNPLEIGQQQYQDFLSKIYNSPVPVVPESKIPATSQTTLKPNAEHFYKLQNRSPVIVSPSAKASNTPAQRDSSELFSQKQFENFISELKQMHSANSSSASTERQNLQKYPSDRVPNVKQRQPSKTVDAPNTFSRLSYMHKNKQNETKPKQTNDVGKILDNICRSKLNSTTVRNTNDKAVEKIYCLDAKEISISKITKSTTVKNNISESHSVILSLLSQKSKCHEIEMKKPISTHSNFVITNEKNNATPLKQTLLTERDRNDLRLLSQQKSLLNCSKTQTKNVYTGALATSIGTTNISNPTKQSFVNQNTCTMANNNTFEKTATQLTPSLSQNKITKVINTPSVESTTSQPNSLRLTNENKPEKPRKQYVKGSSDLVEINKSADATRIELETVLDAISALKTPKRAPNLLEVALQNKTANYNATKPNKDLKPVQLKTTSLIDCKKKDNTVCKVSKANTTLQVVSDKHSDLQSSKSKNSSIRTNVFSDKSSKSIDPFISGLQNSDYELLGELMDDDLRKEIGEILSDEESYLPASSKTKNTISAKNFSSSKNPLTRSNLNLANKISLKTNICPVNSQNTNVAKCPHQGSQISQAKMDTKPIIISNKLISSAVSASSSTSVTQFEHQENITRNNQVTTILCPATQSVNIITNQVSVLNPATVFLTASPTNTTNNIMLLGSELVYNPFPTVQVQESPTNISTSSTCLTLNSKPNLTLYQSTQFVAPVVNPIIIGSATTSPVTCSSSVNHSLLTQPFFDSDNKGISNGIQNKRKYIPNKDGLNTPLDKISKVLDNDKNSLIDTLFLGHSSILDKDDLSTPLDTISSKVHNKEQALDDNKNSLIKTLSLGHTLIPDKDDLSTPSDKMSSKVHNKEQVLDDNKNSLIDALSLGHNSISDKDNLSTPLDTISSKVHNKEQVLDDNKNSLIETLSLGHMLIPDKDDLSTPSDKMSSKVHNKEQVLDDNKNSLIENLSLIHTSIPVKDDLSTTSDKISSKVHNKEQVLDDNKNSLIETLSLSHASILDKNNLSTPSDKISSKVHNKEQVLDDNKNSLIDTLSLNHTSINIKEHSDNTNIIATQSETKPNVERVDLSIMLHNMTKVKEHSLDGNKNSSSLKNFITNSDETDVRNIIQNEIKNGVDRTDLDAMLHNAPNANANESIDNKSFKKSLNFKHNSNSDLSHSNNCIEMSHYSQPCQGLHPQKDSINQKRITEISKVAEEYSSNKNGERKVLSQVQEKLVINTKNSAKIVTKDNVDIDKADAFKEAERIKKKRFTLLNRKINHHSSGEPIVLTYIPLLQSSSDRMKLSNYNEHNSGNQRNKFEQHEHHSTAKKVENVKSNLGSEFNCKLDTGHLKEIKDECTNLKNANFKENKEVNIQTKCRRILLRSSNTVSDNLTKPDTSKLANTGNNVLDKSDLTSSGQLTTRKKFTPQRTIIKNIKRKRTKKTIRKIKNTFQTSKQNKTINKLVKNERKEKYLSTHNITNNPPTLILESKIRKSGEEIPCQKEIEQKQVSTSVSETSVSSYSDVVDKIKNRNLTISSCKLKTDVTKINISMNENDVNSKDTKGNNQSPKKIKNVKSKVENAKKITEKLPNKESALQLQSEEKKCVDQANNPKFKKLINQMCSVRSKHKEKNGQMLHISDSVNIVDNKTHMNYNSVTKDNTKPYKDYSCEIVENVKSISASKHQHTEDTHTKDENTPQFEEINHIATNSSESNKLVKSSRSVKNKHRHKTDLSVVDIDDKMSLSNDYNKEIVKENPSQIVKSIVSKHENKKETSKNTTNEISNTSSKTSQVEQILDPLGDCCEDSTYLKYIKEKIIIQELPGKRRKDAMEPEKKQIRIIIPDGSIYRATISGSLKVDVNTLFENPSIKKILLENRGNLKKCTVNVQQSNVATKNHEIKAHIQEVIYSREALSKKIAPGETIDLISDGEETENDTSLSFKTEFGKFKISSIDSKTFALHQDKFIKKCCVRLDKNMVLPQVSSTNVRSFNKTSSIIKPLQNNHDSLMTQNELGSEIIEIDDSSSESENNLDILTEENLMVCPENEYVHKSCSTTYKINNDKQLLSHTETSITSNSKSSPTLITTAYDKLVTNYVNKTILSNCFVPVVKCDSILKENIKIQNDLTSKPTFEYLKEGNNNSPEILPRSESLSILDDLSMYEEVSSRLQSPSLLDDFAISSHELSNNNCETIDPNIPDTVHVNSVKCYSDWMLIKSDLNVLQKQFNRKLNFVDENEVVDNINSPFAISSNELPSTITSNKTIDYKMSSLAHSDVDKCCSDWMYTKFEENVIHKQQNFATQKFNIGNTNKDSYGGCTKRFLSDISFKVSSVPALTNIVTNFIVNNYVFLENLKPSKQYHKSLPPSSSHGLKRKLLVEVNSKDRKKIHKANNKIHVDVLKNLEKQSNVNKTTSSKIIETEIMSIQHFNVSSSSTEDRNLNEVKEDPQILNKKDLQAFKVRQNNEDNKPCQSQSSGLNNNDIMLKNHGTCNEIVNMSQNDFSKTQYSIRIRKNDVNDDKQIKDEENQVFNKEVCVPNDDDKAMLPEVHAKLTQFDIKSLDNVNVEIECKEKVLNQKTINSFNLIGTSIEDDENKNAINSVETHTNLLSNIKNPVLEHQNKGIAPSLILTNRRDGDIPVKINVTPEHTLKPINKDCFSTDRDLLKDIPVNTTKPILQNESVRFNVDSTDFEEHEKISEIFTNLSDNDVEIKNNFVVTDNSEEKNKIYLLDETLTNVNCINTDGVFNTDVKSIASPPIKSNKNLEKTNFETQDDKINSIVKKDNSDVLDFNVEIEVIPLETMEESINVNVSKNLVLVENVNTDSFSPLHNEIIDNYVELVEDTNKDTVHKIDDAKCKNVTSDVVALENVHDSLTHFPIDDFTKDHCSNKGKVDIVDESSTALESELIDVFVEYTLLEKSCEDSTNQSSNNDMPSHSNEKNKENNGYPTDKIILQREDNDLNRTKSGSFHSGVNDPERSDQNITSKINQNNDNQNYSKKLEVIQSQNTKVNKMKNISNPLISDEITLTDYNNAKKGDIDKVCHFNLKCGLANLSEEPLLEAGDSKNISAVIRKYNNRRDMDTYTENHILKSLEISEEISKSGNEFSINKTVTPACDHIGRVSKTETKSHLLVQNETNEIKENSIDADVKTTTVFEYTQDRKDFLFSNAEKQSDSYINCSSRKCYEPAHNNSVTLVYKGSSDVILKGSIYKDPIIGTCYRFPISNRVYDTVNLIKSKAFSSENSNCDKKYSKFVVALPNRTYSKLSDSEFEAKNLQCGEILEKQSLKRKLENYDHRSVKRYRKGKNIDYPKMTLANIKESAYDIEYRRLIDYFSTIKFSYSTSFYKENIDVINALKCWPITENLEEQSKKYSNKDFCGQQQIFIEADQSEKLPFDPLQQSLAEEISADYSEPQAFDDIGEPCFNMGFGERSGRVIQNLRDKNTISKISAATLSDVKQYQPVLVSENHGNFREPQIVISTQMDQVQSMQRYISYIKLREKVRSFFRQTAIELIQHSLCEKDNNKKSFDDSYLMNDLNGTDFLEPAPVKTIVQVVQVGQLPVSAAAQNPVTCDPRVTQVSDASPSQCSVENSPNDEPQSAIKTEYTELTTADLSLPLMQGYEQNSSITSMEHHGNSNITVDTENLNITNEVNCVDKTEATNKLTDNSEDKKQALDESQRQSLTVNKHINNVTYSYNSNINHLESDSHNTIIFEQIEKHGKLDSSVQQQKQQNGSSEKTDQIAHAMNAAGITPSAENLTNSRAHALVNILSQKIRQSTVSTTPNSANNFTKTTSINAMALQQALAQILPPPLNQTSRSESSQQSQNVTPQVLHIVQGKNTSGNQITIVDNPQNSVISSPNSTPVLHIVQNKVGAASSNTTPNTGQHSNSYSGLSLVDAGLQQGGNQLLHIVNTGNSKNNTSGQLLKRVNLLTNLTNVQGSNEQKMVQFVCKSADGKSIQLNAPHQRSMVLRLQPIETTNVPPVPKTSECQDITQNSAHIATTPNKESNNSQQEIKSRSVYEENYAKFIQNSSHNKTPALEKSTSLPKFNQAFGKQIFQDNSQKTNDMSTNNSHMSSSNTSTESIECHSNENAMNLDHIGQINSPPLLLRKSPAQTTQSSPVQSNLVQQLKQTIAPMNIQTMPGGVIYTRQIPVNIGGGQTINLITVPSSDIVDENNQKQQPDIEPSIIKIIPQNQGNSNTDAINEEGSNHLGVVTEASQSNNQTSAQPVLTQMRIKLPMLSKTPQMVSGARVVRPSFFQIQRNVIGGANQPLYQQLVLTAAPPLGQQTIRLPQTQTTRQVKVASDSQSSTESQMSSSTLEQLREFDMVLEQVKERSTVQPSSNSNSSFSNKLLTTSTDTAGSASPISTSGTETTQQVFYSIGNSHSLNVAYVNRKPVVTTPTTSSFVRSPDSTGVADSPTSTHIQIAHNANESSASEGSSNQNQQKPAKVSSKSKSRPKTSSNPPSSMKINTVPPKTSTQKPLEDEQTTQRILYILAEYKEQVENSPDKDKPAPRRRSNPPSNPSGSSKRKKSSSGSRRPGARDMSPIHGEDTCRTMGSEDSSCGTSQGDCTESCLDSHSPQDSPRKVVRKITFDNETANAATTIPSKQTPQRNVIVADGQTITVARGTAGKPATAVLMPANYILPVSMVKGGQQIAIVTNRGPKILAVGGEGGTSSALLLQRLIGPAGLKPVLARPGVRHVRLPTSALHNLQAFNLATTTIQPPDSTASPAPAPTPPDLVETRATSSPWPDRDNQDVKPERASSPEGSEPWNLPTSADTHDYTYEETVRAENMDRTVLVVQKKDNSQRQHRVAHVSAAALRHKYAILEHELRLQKSLSEECEDLGVDSPSASELFPEAELLFSASPAHETHHSHTPQPALNQSGIPQPDLDDQIATDQLLPRANIHEDQQDLDVSLGLDEEIVTVQPFTIAGLKGRHITSTIFHSARAPTTVLMTAPQTKVISHAVPESAMQNLKYTTIDNMMNSPQAHSINLSSVLVKDDGLTKYDSILNDSRELHLSHTASAIVHSTANAAQVIRRVCYEDDKRDHRFLMDESDAILAGDDAKMVAEDSSRDATLESIAGDVDDDGSSPERHAELFWESNSASERSESRRPLDFSSDSDKCCKSPSFDETNSTDSSGVGAHMRLDSVIKEARGIERSGSADGSSADDTHPPLRTYPPKRMYHSMENEMERSMSGKTRAGERSPDSVEVRRRASGRGVVKRGCHCCNGSPAPPRPKKSRQKKPNMDFTNT